MSSIVDKSLLEQLRRLPDPERSGSWPTERLNCLRDAGVFGWGMPPEFGGSVVDSADLLEGYLDLAHACLTTAFILTQRDAACHRIAGSPNNSLRQRLLPAHCAGRAMATVGISHLSTSRQHWSKPSVIASHASGAFELTGEAPWVTGAGHADLLVTGAILESGDQILVAIPAGRRGLSIGAPLKLLALDAAETGTVILDHVLVGADEVICGPLPNVMKIGPTGGTGSLTTTAVATGAAARTLDGLKREQSARPDLAAVVESLAGEHATLKAELLQTARDSLDASALRAIAESLRFRANSLAARLAQAYLCCAKGAGFVSGHPAEQSLREAMFFQVWSCPPAVTMRTLAELAGES